MSEEMTDAAFFEQQTRRNIRKYAVEIIKAALTLILKAEDEDPWSLEERIDDIVDSQEEAFSFVKTLQEHYEDEDD